MNANIINAIRGQMGEKQKPQQRGPIQYQKWSIMSCKGNPIDVLTKNPPTHKRLLNNQIIKK